MDKLYQYLVNATKKGYSIDEAVAKLEEAGHKKELIDSAVLKYRRYQYEKLGGIVLVAIIGIILLVFFLDSVTTTTYSADDSSYNDLVSAIENKDIGACDQFNPVKKDICIRSIEETIGDVDNENDLIADAIETDNSSLCYKLPDGIQKERCLVVTGEKQPDNVELYEFDSATQEFIETDYKIAEDLTNEAIANNDPELCDEISDPVKKYRCQVKSS